MPTDTVRARTDSVEFSITRLGFSPQTRDELRVAFKGRHRVRRRVPLSLIHCADCAEGVVAISAKLKWSDAG